MNKPFFFIVLFWLIASSRTFGAIGDIFVSTTIEGIEMKFAITSEEEKTCEVWGASWSLDEAVPSDTQGVITIPSEPNGYLVTRIGDYAFSGCSGLTSVIIPENVLSIGNNAFSHCSGISEMLLPKNIKTIGEYAFWECHSVKSIFIPNTVESIGKYAFLDCGMLGFCKVSNRNKWGMVSNRDRVSMAIDCKYDRIIDIANIEIPDPGIPPMFIGSIGYIAEVIDVCELVEGGHLRLKVSMTLADWNRRSSYS